MMSSLEWFKPHSRQTTEELLALEGKYRTDSLVVAFDQTIGQKAFREGDANLTDEKRITLAVEALESEVNNGGYAQFFSNLSVEYAPIIVNSLQRIDCPKAATIAEKAIEALELTELNVEAINIVMQSANESRDFVLDECDKAFFRCEEDIAGKLLAFIRKNREAIRL